MVIAPVEKNQGWGAGSANFFRRHAYNKMSTALKIWERGENSGPDTDTRTDEELLLSYRRTGVPGDFARLVKRFEGEIYAYLRRYLGDPHLAEDAFQATFLQMHLKCDQFEAGRRVRPWLYMIATHQAIDLKRRNRRHRSVSLDQSAGGEDAPAGNLGSVLESRGMGPADTVSGSEEQAWVQKALEDLPESLRLVVDLVYFQGLKYREAAEVLSIPVGTAKSRVHAAILKLTEDWNSTQVEP